MLSRTPQPHFGGFREGATCYLSTMAPEPGVLQEQFELPGTPQELRCLCMGGRAGFLANHFLPSTCDTFSHVMFSHESAGDDSSWKTCVSEMALASHRTVPEPRNHDTPVLRASTPPFGGHISTGIGEVSKLAHMTCPLFLVSSGLPRVVQA